MKLSLLPAELQFQWALRNPRHSQEYVWVKHKKYIKNSSFWKQKYTNIQNMKLSDFEITDYGDYEDEIHKLMHEKISSLNGEKILYWSLSGGTTNKLKYIPMTKAYLKEFNKVTAPYLFSLCTRFNKFPNKSTLYFAYADTGETSPSGIEIGGASRYHYKNLPSYMKKFYAFPEAVFVDSSTFFTYGPYYALVNELSSIVATTPSIIKTFLDNIIKNKNFYMDLITAKETLPSNLPFINLDQERKTLLLEELGEIKPNFNRIWPDLCFISTWTSGICSHQKTRLQTYFNDSTPIVDACYTSTEGWMNVPLYNLKPGGPLHPLSHIYEFLPVGKKLKKENLVSLWELKKDESYEIFLTTAAGLVRYRLHDIVKCNGYTFNTPNICFENKTQHYLALGVGIISEYQLVNAWKDASLNQENQVKFSTDKEGKSILIFSDLDSIDKNLMVDQFENQLKTLNDDYRENRQKGLMNRPKFYSLKSNHQIFNQKVLHTQTKPKIILENNIDTQGITQ
jgi:hypothetical protein